LEADLNTSVQSIVRKLQALSILNDLSLAVAHTNKKVKVIPPEENSKL